MLQYGTVQQRIWYRSASGTSHPEGRVLVSLLRWLGLFGSVMNPVHLLKKQTTSEERCRCWSLCLCLWLLLQGLVLLSWVCVPLISWFVTDFFISSFLEWCNSVFFFLFSTRDIIITETRRTRPLLCLKGAAVDHPSSSIKSKLMMMVTERT